MDMKEGTLYLVGALTILVCLATEPFEDKAKFIKDINYPDSGVDRPTVSVKVGTTITKKWLVQNVGDQTWQDRRLIAVEPYSGLEPKGFGTVKFNDKEGKTTVVKPTELAVYSADLVAKKNGVWTVYYKMQKKSGEKWVDALPNQKAVYVTIEVK